MGLEKILRAALLTLPLISCTTKGAGPSGNAVATVTAPVSASVVGGYVLDVGHSKVRIGANPALEISAPQIQRWRGDLGAFATDPTNGWSMGMINARTSQGPYVLDAKTQATMVTAYFAAAGLPQDQVGAVETMFEATAGGPMVGAKGHRGMSLHSLNTILRRKVRGVRVADSMAWAKMTVTGETDTEEVFWPPLSLDVVNAAAAFLAQMANPSAHAAYLAKLPGAVYQDVGVVIHHTGPATHSAALAFVSYDASLSPAAEVPVRHFDVNGVEFRLPDEGQN